MRKQLTVTAARRRAALAITTAFALAGFAAPAANASVAKCNVPIKTSDGTVLRANVFLPSDKGTYPTVLTVSGYNKDATNPLGTGCTPGGALASVDGALLDKGYALMLVDDRGTGASQGQWDSWGKRTQADYKDVLDFIQAQSWSNDDVAATGGSYMGITSLLVAEADAARVAAGKKRAVKAVWADIPMADAYRDVTYHGGSVDSGFIPLWLGLTSGLSDLPPSTFGADPGTSTETYLAHLRNQYDFAAQKIISASTGGDAAYDGAFYRLRSPVTRAAEIRVPVVIQGGWRDIFQRGEPLLFESLVNSPHKMLFMSDHYHVSSGPDPEDPNTKTKWFARWLKGAKNGVENRPRVNLYPVGGTKWEHFSDWPVRGTKYTKLHLDSTKSGSANSLNDGSLTRDKAKDAGGDTAPLLPVSSPCSRLTAQWTAGAGALGPCETDNRTFEATSLTYTTQPLKHDTTLTGLITANLWAELTSKDATLVAVLSDVDASGASNQITAGFLLASQRARDTSKETRGPGGITIRPWHPFTTKSQEPVKPGQAKSYAIEIYPTSAVFKAGHRMRLTIATANTPTTMTPLPDLLNEAGGTVRLLHGGRYDSSLLLPFAP
jgi:putative CocE/NonD family hydrolase